MDQSPANSARLASMLAGLLGDEHYWVTESNPATWHHSPPKGGPVALCMIMSSVHLAYRSSSSTSLILCTCSRPRKMNMITTWKTGMFYKAFSLMGARAGTTITKIPNLGKFAEEFTRSYHLVGRKSDFDKKNWSSSRAQWARISSWLAGSEAGSHPETGSAGGESGYSMRDGARSERNHEFAAEPSKPTRQGVGLELAWLMFGGIEISGTMLLASYSWCWQRLGEDYTCDTSVLLTPEM
ncbi:hypothetical protein PSTT_06832 [Puccinia striiformis]|uniref:Uncharacterized protein n=2 Tax=Puccinia striiformis TaxID=27350 RepID=A0A0L0UYD5_9BASI|nr:hypothetical protein PSTG_14553 [Puccinia striiformis f. sp. tritici PST-78]POW09460.1 hypothetical protein PSTT_06832 [Puccinia striiformis]